MKEIPLEQLLADLDTSCTDLGCPVKTWMDSEGYRAGCHRLTTLELYGRFVRWWTGTGRKTAEITPEHEFVNALRKYVKVSRGKNGQFAYMGRDYGK